jgi:hypothetical protein
MTQQEFEARVKRNVTPQEFETAQELYMAAGDMDKDNFCKEYESLIESSRLARELEKTIRSLKDSLTRERKNRENDGRNLLGIAVEVREGGMEASAEQLEDFSTYLLGGRAEVIRAKLGKGYALTDRDYEYIKHNLK